jgi:hypothetical protein
MQQLQQVQLWAHSPFDATVAKLQLLSIIKFFFIKKKSKIKSSQVKPRGYDDTTYFLKKILIDTSVDPPFDLAISSVKILNANGRNPRFTSKRGN